jgi:cytochrome d ubiquinol oxidase subunit I
MVRAQRQDRTADARAFRPVFRLALWVMLVAGIGVAVTGDQQAKLMFEQQPMKMAAAEALCTTEAGAGFSIIAIGTPGTQNCDVRTLSIPGLTSFLATGDRNGTVTGVNDLQGAATEKFGEGDYVPNLAVTYWAFRLMIGFGMLSAILALWGLWVTRRGAMPTSDRFGTFALWAVPMPFLANLAGWIFTEMGRQPWIVAPNPTGADLVRLLTADGVSGVAAWTVALSLVVFTVVYGALAVVWFTLMRRYVREGPPDVGAEALRLSADDVDRPLTFAY